MFSTLRLSHIKILVATAVLLFTQVQLGTLYAQKTSKKKSQVDKASTPEPQNIAGEALTIEAMKFIMKGEPDLAIPHLQKLVEQSPTSGAGHFLLATTLAKLDKLDEAILSGEKAYSLDKNNIFYGKFLAENYTRKKKYTEAATVYEEILKLDPTSIQNHIELAAVYVFTDQYDKAIATYDKLEKTMGITEEVSRQKQNLFLRQNKLDAAIKEAERLIASEPNEASYYINLAELYIANERYEEGTKTLNKALQVSPDAVQANVLLADIYRRQGNMAKCIQELEVVFKNASYESTPKIRVLSGLLAGTSNPEELLQLMSLSKSLMDVHPNDSRTYVIYADLLAQDGKIAEARDHYARAARINGSIYEVWGALVQLDGELNQIDSMLVHSESALEYFPTQGMLWYSNGSAHLAKKNYKKAVSSLEESRRLLTNNPMLMKFINAQLGDAYNGLNEHTKSDAAYELVLKEDPENDHVLNNYSYFLSLRKANLTKAAEMSGKLVKRNPDNATYLDTHAWVLYVQKDYKGAKPFLEKAIADEKNLSPTIVEHYGDVLYQLGDTQGAIQQWKRAQKLGEGSEFLDKKIATGKLHE